MSISSLGIVVAAGLVAFFVAWRMRSAAGRLGLLQAPNQRSSHAVPTPSGGGVGIVAGGTLATLGAAWAIFSGQGLAKASPLLALVVLSLGLGFVGYRDDVKPVRARWRLLAQVLALGLAILVAVDLSPLSMALGGALPWPVLFVLVVLVGVYWINLFNFMDGIDGLAAMQAAFMLFAAAGLILAHPEGLRDPAGLPLVWWLLGLGAAVLGFLSLNWPPARIFMGDAGSLYLGLMLAVLALVSIGQGLVGVWPWLILACLFVSDASVTLTHRLWRRERVFEAHRRHAYQFLARQFGTHQPVTLLYLAVNLIWVLPLAVAAQLHPTFAPVIAGLAYAPLLVLAVQAGAGRPERV